MVAELSFQLQRDRGQSAKVRERAADDLERVRRATEAIRRMTRIYQERLDGRRVDDAR